MEFDIDPDDAQQLNRLLVIRTDKEKKLRRQLTEHQRARETLYLLSQSLQDDRNKIITKQVQQEVPQAALTPTEFVRFKLILAKDYQQERTLAQKLLSNKLKIDDLTMKMDILTVDIKKLAKAQEKLKVILDE